MTNDTNSVKSNNLCFFITDCLLVTSLHTPAANCAHCVHMLEVQCSMIHASAMDKAKFVATKYTNYKDAIKCTVLQSKRGKLLKFLKLHNFYCSIYTYKR